MLAPTQKKLSTPAVTGGDFILLAVLLALGGTGALVARQQLAALQSESDLLRPPSNLLAERVSRAGDIADPAPPSRVPDEAPPPVEIEAAGSGSSGTVRIQSLGMLTDLLSRRFVSAPMGPTAILGGTGGTAPAYSFDSDGKLSPNFGQLFGLSPDQVAILQDTTTTIKQRVDEAIAANTKVEQVGTDSYRIDNTPSDEAAALRAQFENTFRSVLGDERYRAFAMLNGERDQTGTTRADVTLQRTGPSAFFGSFGEDKRTITISKANGRYDYRATAGNSSSSGGAPNLENLKQRFNLNPALLPDGF